ncbi:MAG TPA: DUF805 domain-containing protein [Methyloceanibacter sp.]|nr:DUF805 domain-containing protein [Methyloceanibacter sp.]
MIDLKHFLFSFNGRIGRRYWWFGSLAVAFLAGMANSLMEIMAKTSGHGTIDPTTQEFVPSAPYVVAILTLGLFNLWISCAIAAKRLHDRDRTGWWLVLPLIAISAAFAAIAWASNLPEDQSTPYFVVGIAILLTAMAIGIWLTIELGFLKGTQGPNRFGADPRAPKTEDGPLSLAGG